VGYIGSNLVTIYGPLNVNIELKLKYAKAQIWCFLVPQVFNQKRKKINFSLSMEAKEHCRVNDHFHL